MTDVKEYKNSLEYLLECMKVEILSKNKDYTVNYLSHLLMKSMFDIKDDGEWIDIITKSLESVGFIFIRNFYTERYFKGQVIIWSEIKYLSNKKIQIVIDKDSITALNKLNILARFRFNSICDIKKCYEDLLLTISKRREGLNGSI